MSARDGWKGGPLTDAQWQAIQAEASANGEMVFIDTVILDPPGWWGDVFGWLLPCTTARGPKPSRRSDKRRFASYPQRHGKALVPQWPFHVACARVASCRATQALSSSWAAPAQALVRAGFRRPYSFTETSVIFGAVIGTVVFREPFGRWRIAATLLLVSGVLLLNVA